MDLDAGTVALLGRGDGERELLTLPHETAATLRAWLTVRGTESVPLFVNSTGRGRARG